MIALVVRFELAPGAESAFDVLMAATCRGVAEREPGTLVYAVTRDAARPSLRTFLEVYVDDAALEAHEAQPHTRRFLESRVAHLAAPIEVERFVVSELALHPPDRPAGA
jgi:quinol monooxygenase YgiN